MHSCLIGYNFVHLICKTTVTNKYLFYYKIVCRNQISQSNFKTITKEILQQAKKIIMVNCLWQNVLLFNFFYIQVLIQNLFALLLTANRH